MGDQPEDVTTALRRVRLRLGTAEVRQCSLIQAKVRSMTQRRGSNTKVCGLSPKSL